MWFYLDCTYALWICVFVALLLLGLGRVDCTLLGDYSWFLLVGVLGFRTSC